MYDGICEKSVILAIVKYSLKFSLNKCFVD